MDYSGNIVWTEGPHTWEEFLDLDDEDRRELIDGEFVEVEVPGAEHEYAVAELIYHVKGWAKQHRGGEVYASAYKVRIADKRGVMPDLQYFARDNPHRRQPRAVATGRPDLAVEVISPASTGYDRITKAHWYASIGVPEYWVVDPFQRTLERFLLEGGAYTSVEYLSGAGGYPSFFRPETFPGLEIPLSDLWIGDKGLLT